MGGIREGPSFQQVSNAFPGRGAVAGPVRDLVPCLFQRSRLGSYWSLEGVVRGFFCCQGAGRALASCRLAVFTLRKSLGYPPNRPSHFREKCSAAYIKVAVRTGPSRLWSLALLCGG